MKNKGAQRRKGVEEEGWRRKEPVLEKRWRNIKAGRKKGVKKKEGRAEGG